MSKNGRMSIASVTAIAVTTLLISAVTTGTKVTVNASSAAVKWPPIVTGTLNSAVGGPVKSIPFGTAFTATQLRLAESRNSWVASIVGVNGYALVYIDRFQYPLFTKNGGETWTIAGAYFTNGGAQGGAGAVTIDTYGSSIAVAYGNQWPYTTIDGGRHWYVMGRPPGIVESAYAFRENWVTFNYPRTAIVANLVSLASYNGPAKITSRAEYLTTNGGKSWRLLTVS
jgi:hypothetical protein